MTKRGLYIVIEGPEGVGKTTQVELLADKLRAQGRLVRIAREPDSQSELTARAIRRLTQDPRYPMNTKTEVLLYNAARSQSLDVIRMSNEAGIDCIVDRSFLTTLGVQYYGRGDVKDYDLIDKIIKFAVGDMYPDVMLILDAPVDVLMKRFEHRYHGERFDNLDKDFIERVRNGYLLEAEKRAIPVLDAQKTPEILSSEILTHVAYARDAVVDRPRTLDNIGLPAVPVDEVPQVKPQASILAIARGFSVEQQVLLKELRPNLEYYRPENLGKKVLGAYDTILKKILENYAKAVTDYSKHLATQAIHNKKPFKVEKLMTESRQLCRSLLPVSLLIEAEGSEGIEEISETTDGVAKIVSELLPNIDSETPKLQLSLSSHSPRNEFEVLEDVIFENSDQSTASIKHLVDELTYEKKAKLLKDSLGTVTSLQNVNYNFNVFCEFRQLLDLLVDIGGKVTMQELTPRNGYDIPEKIESAGLADLYQQSFDLSLELYSLLQAAGFDTQAQYAVLLGHRVRAKLMLSYKQVKRLSSGKNIGYRPLARDIKQQVSGVHPLLWSA